MASFFYYRTRASVDLVFPFQYPFRKLWSNVCLFPAGSDEKLKRKLRSKLDTRGQDYKKNTNSTQNKSQTHRAEQYEVTSFLSTDCELSTETCSKNVYSLGPRSSSCCHWLVPSSGVAGTFIFVLRVTMANIKGQHFDINIIKAYAPTSDHSDDETEVFYEEMKQAMKMW